MLLPKWLIAVFLLLLGWNLFGGGLYLTIWEGAEAQVVGDTRRVPGSWLESLWQWISPAGEPGPLRLLSAAWVVLGLAAWWVLARPLFGRDTTLLAGLLMGSSYILSFLAHSAAAGTALFALQLLQMLFLLRFLKQGPWYWMLAAGLCWGLSMQIHIKAFALGLLIPLGLYVYHPEGKRFWQPLPLLLYVLPMVLFVLARGDELFAFLPTYLTGAGLRYYPLVLLGCWPILAFVVSGIREFGSRWPREEEFARIAGSCLLAALLSLSLVAVAILALLAAQQMKAYFAKGYPYRNLVNAAYIISVVLAFVATVFAVVLAYRLYGPEGFRTGALISLGYWMPAFIGALGLFGRRPLWLKGGVLAGFLLPAAFFWWRGTALMETAGTEDLRALAGALPVQEAIYAQQLPPSAEWYLRRNGMAVKNRLRPPRADDQAAVYLLPDSTAQAFTCRDSFRLRRGVLRMDTYYRCERTQKLD